MLHEIVWNQRRDVIQRDTEKKGMKGKKVTRTERCLGFDDNYLSRGMSGIFLSIPHVGKNVTDTTQRN